MLVYHYPGLEFIEERRDHWELNIPIKKFKAIYPELDRKPGIKDVNNYLINREKYAKLMAVKSFIHLWYFDESIPFWDETIKYICNQKRNFTPVSLVWCWKRPHHSPLNNCSPHNVIQRCDKRELIDTIESVKKGVYYIFNNYFKSRNFYTINNKPVIFFYHVEGWQEIFHYQKSIFDYIKNLFKELGIEPYLVGITVTKVNQQNLNRFHGLDALSRYNDLPNFANNNNQDFETQTLACIEKWREILYVLKNSDLEFIPSLSLGWNATLRLSNELSDKLEGYPATPIVSNPSPNQIQWCINLAKEFVSRNSINHFSICAWNEWTENAALEYFSKYCGVTNMIWNS